MKLENLNLKVLCNLLNEGLDQDFCKSKGICHDDFNEKFNEEGDKVKDYPNFHIVINDKYCGKNNYSYHYTDLENVICDLLSLIEYNDIIEKAVIDSVLNGTKYSEELLNILNDTAKDEDIHIFKSYQDFFDEFRNIDEGVIATSFSNTDIGAFIVTKTLDDFVKEILLDDSYLESRINATSEQFNNFYDITDYDDHEELEAEILECFGQVAEFEEEAIIYSNYDAQEFFDKYILKQVINKIETKEVS